MHQKSNKSPYVPHLGNQDTSFSTLLDVLDPDPQRLAQRQKYLKHLKKTAYKANAKRKAKKPTKPKGLSIDEKLEITQKWLQQTFPALFDPSQPCKALDVHIVRDIKDHYKQHHVKNKYPRDLIIKAALYRYLETPQYLECLVEGAPRYNIRGEIVGVVSSTS